MLARVWPAPAAGLEPDGAAGHAQEPPRSCEPCASLARLWVTAAPIHSPAFAQIGITRVGSKLAVGFAPCDAVVPVTSDVSRTRIGASLFDFPICVPHLVPFSLLTSLAPTDTTQGIMCRKSSWQNS